MAGGHRGVCMSGDETPAIVAEVVRCVRGLSSRAALTADEQKFVNEQARLISDQVMHEWAKSRYGGRRKIRACCVGLAVAVALDVAHRMSLPGEALNSPAANPDAG